jgi:hypothetical protein
MEFALGAWGCFHLFDCFFRWTVSENHEREQQWLRLRHGDDETSRLRAPVSPD